MTHSLGALIMISLAACAGLSPLAGEATAQDAAPAAQPAEQSIAPAAGGPTVAIVVGAAGEEQYGSQFESSAKLWLETAARSGGKVIRLDAPEEARPALASDAAEAVSTDRQRMEAFLADEPADELYPLWLVLIGHGTFDGRVAKFNLKGPDVSASDLAGWLERFSRPVVLIDCTSSSSPFMSELSAPGRVIVTATRSGWEMNYARFGQYFAAAVGDPQADLDKDHQTSVLEAFLKASADVAEFYKTESRLATEHGLIDDNGDGLGTQYDWFRGVRAIVTPAGGASIDGTTAHQIHLIPSQEERRMPGELRDYRDFLERELVALRENKSLWQEEAYYNQFQYLALALADVYGWLDAPVGSPPEPPPIDWWILGE